jgi:exodeoxyribonuclease VII large subunit
MFRGYALHNKFKPEDGMEVLIRARITVYEPRGDYQLFCEVMEPVGFGALQMAFEKLKIQLQSEGLFDPKRKKAIPSFPKKIAIVTSPTGAAIKDMLNVLERRFGGGLDILLVPTSVQGDKAPEEIKKAVIWVSEQGPSRFDVLIVGRGGGSIEDLWAFNTEAVARSVAACTVPTISAVGHEIDFTICDFVADLRAPTPSAAAELVVKNKSEVSEKIALLERQIFQLTLKGLHVAQFKTQGFAKRLIDPKRRLQDLMLRCDEWTDRLLQAMQRFILDSELQIKFLVERMPDLKLRVENLKQRNKMSSQLLENLVSARLEEARQKFLNQTGKLNSLSPLAVLGRGFSIVKKGDQIIKSSDHLQVREEVQVQLAQGQFTAQVTSTAAK